MWYTTIVLKFWCWEKHMLLAWQSGEWPFSKDFVFETKILPFCSLKSELFFLLYIAESELTTKWTSQ